MILIQQGMTDIGNLGSLVSKVSDTEIKLNTEIITEDIHKIENMMASAKNKSDKANMEGIVKYLKKLRSKVDSSGNFQFTWMLDKWKVRAYPFELRHFEPYKVQATDYIELNGSSIVKIDYRNVFEIIAFDMMYRDLGYDLEDIEKQLEHVGIAAVVGDNQIMPIMDGDSPVDLSKVFKMGDSPYASADCKMSWDYFGTAALPGEEAFDTGRYRDCVGRSIEFAICLILKELIERFNDNSLKFRICALNEDGLYFMVDNLNSVDIYNIIDSVVVRAFGRRFEVKPNIIVF